MTEPPLAVRFFSGIFAATVEFLHEPLRSFAIELVRDDGGYDEDEILLAATSRFSDLFVLPMMAAITATMEAPGPPVRANDVPPWLPPDLVDLARAMLDEILPRIDFTEYRESFFANGCQNRTDLDRSLSLDKILLLPYDGYPVAWVPRPSIIAELTRSIEPDERPQVLSDNREAVLDDCLNVLADIEDEQVHQHVELAIEAAEVARGGRYRAGQALATTLFDTLLRGYYDQNTVGVRGYYKSIQRLARLGAAEFRHDLTALPIAAALEEFFPSKGNPVPATYNRHASSHAAGNLQYSLPNSLVSIMLVTSMLRDDYEKRRSTSS